MTPSAVIIRATYLPPFKGVYFSLKKQLLNCVQLGKKNFFIVYDVIKNM